MTRRVKVTDLLGEPLEIEMPNGDVYRVANLGVDDMMEMFALEGNMIAEKSAEDQAAALVETRDYVVGIIRRENPGAFEKDGVVVKPNWSPQAVMALLAALSGNDSVAAEVREALAGTPEERAARMAEIERQRADAEARGEKQPEEDGDPLDSTRPSPTPSSNSDADSDGTRSGGASPAAPGDPSEHTSDTYAAHV